MPGRSVQIGPFSGGLNNVSVSGEAQDAEVLELVNFEVGPDASLTTRPLIQQAEGSYIDPSTIGGQQFNVLGIYRASSTEWYVVVSKPTGATTASILAYLNGDFTDTPLNIKVNYDSSANTVTSMAQIDDIAYFCVGPGSTISGFKWNKITTTDIAAMKKGFAMVAFKLRLWVAGTTLAANNSRVYFSAIDDTGYKPEVWNANDFFDAAAGEGGYITALLPVGDNLLVFKNDGTWRFSYGSSVAGGQVSKISGSVGAANANAVVEFENYVYVYDQGRLYELVNNSTTHLNRFCKFTADEMSLDSGAIGVDVSVVNRRVVVRYLNTLYAYSVDTKTWSQWRSLNGTPGRFYEMPADSALASASVYVAPSKGTLQNIGSNQVDAFDTEFGQYIKTNLETIPGASVNIEAVTEYTITLSPSVNTDYSYALNNKLGPSVYNLRPTGGRKYKVTGKITNISGSATNHRMVMYWKNIDGTISNTPTAIVPDGSGNFTIVFTAPAGTIEAELFCDQNIVGGNTYQYTISNVSLTYDNSVSPVSMIVLQDDYLNSPSPQEYIYAHMKTKSYDYKAPASIKRLFWWAADLKTNLLVKSTLIPVAIKKGPTWGELKNYTWGQVRQGMWRNPLSWQGNVINVSDSTDPQNVVTENGRILIKFIKGIRFKQLAFEIDLESQGTIATGPAKIHSLITFILPKQKVVDKVN